MSVGGCVKCHGKVGRMSVAAQEGARNVCSAGRRVREMSVLLWNELRTDKTVNARSWSWLEQFSVRKPLKSFRLFPPRSTVEVTNSAHTTRWSTKPKVNLTTRARARARES